MNAGLGSLKGIDPRHRIGLITDVSERPVTVKMRLIIG